MIKVTKNYSSWNNTLVESYDASNKCTGRVEIYKVEDSLGQPIAYNFTFKEEAWTIRSKKGAIESAKRLLLG